MSSEQKSSKVKKPFSWDQYHERQIALRIAYIGWDYKGFVMQKDTQETIEEKIFNALERTRLIKSRDKKECHYTLCGRTDVGVSGVGNVISVRVRSVYPFGKGAIKNENAPIKEEELNYIQILNGVLPPAIRATAYAYVDPEFNARHECISRGYRYLFHMMNKNIVLMKEAANYLIGEHDYRGFCKFSPSNTKHCVRKIYSIEFNEISGQTGLWYFQIVGSGFIWHQIRCIAAILFMVGDGYEKPSIVQELLDIKKYPGRPQYNYADPEPLVFWIAEYPESVEWVEPAEGSSEKEKIKNNFNQLLIKQDISLGVLEMFNGGPPTEQPKKKNPKPISSLQMAKSVEELIEKYKDEKGIELSSEEEEGGIE